MALTDEDYRKKYKNFEQYFKIDQPVYRVMPIERVLQLVNDARNVLVHPSKWDDPFENFFLNANFKGNAGGLSVEQIKAEVFGQCWTLNEKETDALWRIYSPTKNGVRVKSTLDRIFRPLANQYNNNQSGSTYIGKVRYVDEKKLATMMDEYVMNESDFSSSIEGDIIDSLIMKRDAFEHEGEVRLIYRGEPNLTGGIHGYKIDPQEFIQELLFDPRMDQYLYNIYKDHLEKRLQGCDILQSTLYRFPKFSVNIRDGKIT